MRGVQDSSRLGQQYAILNPLIFADRSITVHHVSQSLNFCPGGNHHSCFGNARLILQQRRPVENKVLSCARANWDELGEIRFARRGGYEYGSNSKDGDTSNNNHQKQNADAVGSRDADLLFPLRQTIHTNRHTRISNSSKRIPDRRADERHERSSVPHQRELVN